MEKKLRIQLFEDNGSMVSDRLVTQGSEFYNGPKAKHDGPIRIEFTIMDNKDLDDTILYLQKLKGLVPLEKKNKKNKSKVFKDSDSREDFLKDLIENHTGDQRSMISYLRDNGFAFITTEFFEVSKDFNIDIRKNHRGYQWLVKRIRLAKNPRSDRFDPMLAFGISVFEPDEKVKVYLNGKYNQTINVPLPDSPTEVVKKSGLLKFPKYMVHEERDKFRVEYRALKDNPEKKPSKFFRRWSPWVENLPEKYVTPVETEENNIEE